MNKNFTTLTNNVAGFIGDTSASMKTYIGKYLNIRYFDILRRINWQNIRDDYTVTTTASTKDYSLPRDFGKELYVLDTTNKKRLSRMDLQEWFNEYYSDPTGTGTPDYYLILESPVKAQPTSASVLACVSSSASDTTQVLHIRGIANSVEVEEDVTLTGVTPANTSNSYTRVIGISKDIATTGYQTITSNSAAVTIAIISKETLETRYKTFRLAKTPSATIIYGIPYIIKPLPLVDQYDYPVIDCADGIEEGAIATSLRKKKQYAKAKDHELLYEKWIIDFIWDNENQPNQIRTFGVHPYPRIIV